MKTILLVEDAQELAQVIIRELEASNFRLVHTGDGALALPLYKEHSPDMVILDWMLPNVDGLAVLRGLRQLGSTPVLMLTARDEEMDRVLGLELGADDYLTKPFGMRELIARVRALLRRSEVIQQTLQNDRSSDESPVHVDSLYMEPRAYLVTLEGHPLDLTRTEFMLLHLLLRNPGRAFSRDYLLDTVWGQDYVEGDRAVDNAILRLRKKLGASGEAIETVWGVGYRWRGRE
jgi:DNA-binding response OmpR family regulator